MDKELFFFRQDLQDQQDTVRLHHVNLGVAAAFLAKSDCKVTKACFVAQMRTVRLCQWPLLHRHPTLRCTFVVAFVSVIQKYNFLITLGTPLSL